MNKELIQKYADNIYPRVGDYKTNRYGNDQMNEYIRKELFDVIELENGFLCGFDKPRIKTSFCFSDEGSEFEKYEEIHKNDDLFKKFFFSENLARYDELIAVYEGEDDYKIPVLYNIRKGDCQAGCGWRRDEGGLEVSETDKKAIIEKLKEIRSSFEKRLETWWKRYGKDKVRTWTYWADR